MCVSDIVVESFALCEHAVNPLNIIKYQYNSFSGLLNPTVISKQLKLYKSKQKHPIDWDFLPFIFFLNEDS